MTSIRLHRHGSFTLVLASIASMTMAACASSDTSAEETDSTASSSAELSRISRRDPASIVVSAYNSVLNDLDEKTLDTAFAKHFVQHNSSVPDGRAGLAALIDFRRT